MAFLMLHALLITSPPAALQYFRRVESAERFLCYTPAHMALGLSGVALLSGAATICRRRYRSTKFATCSQRFFVHRGKETVRRDCRSWFLNFFSFDSYAVLVRLARDKESKLLSLFGRLWRSPVPESYC